MADAVCRWSSLPGHLLEEIAIRTLIAPTLTESWVHEDFNDFMTFRKVCTSWREIATKDLFVANYSRASQLPYLMLPEKEGSDEREFYNVFTGKIIGKASFPEVSGKRCIEARFGWLLTLAYSGEVQLFNPISRSCIQLPSFKNSCGYFAELNPPHLVFRRAVLSANPSKTSDFVLVVRTNYNMMEFWRNGDENWSLTEKPYEDADSIQDIMYSERDKLFYGICGSGLIYSWDHIGNVIDRKGGMCGRYTGVRSGSVQGYLMESPSPEDGDLLLVTRNGVLDDDLGRYGATIFKVFRINVAKESGEQVGRLKDEAIFVGHNAAICVPTSKFAGLVRSSCIYFSDDSIEAYTISCRISEDEEESEKNQGDLEEEEEERKDEHGNKEEEEEEDDDDEDDDDEGEGEGEEEVGDEEKKEMEFFWGGGSFDSTKGGGKDMGIYNIEFGSIERFDECVETLSLVCPALWITSPSQLS